LFAILDPIQVFVIDWEMKSEEKLEKIEEFVAVD
jgi:hypothetical protein